MLRARLLDHALVLVHALVVHHVVAILAAAFEATGCVGARLCAVMRVQRAFVNVHTTLIIGLRL